MRVTIEVLKWATTGVYLGAAVVALRIRGRTANQPATWLAAAFGSLGVVLISGFFFPEPPYPGGWLWAAKALIAVLLVFPYLLLRFSSSLDSQAVRGDRLALWGTAALVVWTVGIPQFFAPAAARPWWSHAYTLALVALWFGISVAAARRLWRSGRGQAPVVARRLRMMSAGSGLVAVAILGALFAPDGGQGPEGVAVATQILSGGSGLMFLLAFTAPRWLRAFWRRADEQATRDAAGTCIRAASVAELCDALLPHVRSVVGGTAAILAGPDGRLLGRVGLDPAEAAGLCDTQGDEPDPSLLSVSFPRGRLVIVLNQQAPFAGAEETSLVRSFAGFADAALERLSLLERTDRMRAEFIAMLSHDMRAPLTAARGMIETLASEWDKLDDELRRELLTRASNNGIKLGAMIEQMLEHSQLEAGRVETMTERINLGRVVADMVEHLGTLLDGHRVVTDVSPNLFAIADRQAVERILTNLIVNAAKYSPAGTRIVVAAAQRESTVTLTVSDEGPGIAPEDRARVFDSFYRGKRTNGSSGLGLGLAIVRRLAELQDGRVEIAGTDRGSTFTVVLPGGSERFVERRHERAAG